jgi:hypothetical protein
MTARFARPALFKHSPRAVLLALWFIAGALLVAAPTSASPHAARLSGFGAPIGAWKARFAPDTQNCNASNCYGPVVPRSSARFEFTYVTTAKGRVDGYDEALRKGTSLLRAELEVAQMFPNDVQMGSLEIRHHDAFGNSCAYYDLSSKTLEHVFGSRAFGKSNGTVGVELATVLPSGATTYNPNDINLALVVPAYLGSDSYC